MPTTGGQLSKPKAAKKPVKIKGLTPSGGAHFRGGTSGQLTPVDPTPTKTSTIIPGMDTGDGSRVVSPGLGTGGTFGGTGTGFVDGGGDAQSGGMSGGYTPMGYGGVRWDNPDALAQDFLSGLGIDNPEMISLLGNLVNSLPALQLIQSGDPNLDAQQSFDTDYLTNMMTPGGSAMDVSALMEQLANADPNSAAGMFMMDPSTTSDDIVGLAMNLLNASGANPYYQRGYQGLMESNARNYEIDKAKGAQGFASSPFYQNALNQYGG